VTAIMIFVLALVVDKGIDRICDAIRESNE
jgi:hypothetical protein